MIDTAKPIAESARTEMARIKRLFEQSDGDKEDLISYAREVAALRFQAEAAPLRPDSALTRLAAELHRAKWQFDLSEDYQPAKATARALIAKAFNELHRIGDMALKFRDEAKDTPAGQRQDGAEPVAWHCPACEAAVVIDDSPHSPPRNAWQPIDTAPKEDKTPIIVCSDYSDDVAIVRWDAKKKDWLCLADGMAVIENQDDFGTTYLYFSVPTHWQPCPSSRRIASLSREESSQP